MHQSQCVCWCCLGSACCVAPSVQGRPTAQTPSPTGWAETDGREGDQKLHSPLFSGQPHPNIPTVDITQPLGHAARPRVQEEPSPPSHQGVSAQDPLDLGAALVQREHRVLTPRSEQSPGPPAEPSTCSTPGSLNTSSPSFPV